MQSVSQKSDRRVKSYTHFKVRKTRKLLRKSNRLYNKLYSANISLFAMTEEDYTQEGDHLTQ